MIAVVHFFLWGLDYWYGFFFGSKDVSTETLHHIKRFINTFAFGVKDTVHILIVD